MQIPADVKTRHWKLNVPGSGATYVPGVNVTAFHVPGNHVAEAGVDSVVISAEDLIRLDRVAQANEATRRLLARELGDDEDSGGRKMSSTELAEEMLERLARTKRDLAKAHAALDTLGCKEGTDLSERFVSFAEANRELRKRAEKAEATLKIERAHDTRRLLEVLVASRQSISTALELTKAVCNHCGKRFVSLDENGNCGACAPSF